MQRNFNSYAKKCYPKKLSKKCSLKKKHTINSSYKPYCSEKSDNSYSDNSCSDDQCIGKPIRADVYKKYNSSGYNSEDSSCDSECYNRSHRSVNSSRFNNYESKNPVPFVGSNAVSSLEHPLSQINPSHELMPHKNLPLFEDNVESISASLNKPKNEHIQRRIIYYPERNGIVSVWNSLPDGSEMMRMIGQFYYGDIINVESEIVDNMTNKLKYLKVIHNDLSGYIRAFINNLPTTESLNEEYAEINKEKLKIEESKVVQVNNECSVCLNNLVNQVALPCGHCKFCKDCIDQLLVKKCPVCRKSFDTYIKLYG